MNRNNETQKVSSTDKARIAKRFRQIGKSRNIGFPSLLSGLKLAFQSPVGNLGLRLADCAYLRLEGIPAPCIHFTMNKFCPSYIDRHFTSQPGHFPRLHSPAQTKSGVLTIAVDCTEKLFARRLKMSLQLVGCENDSVSIWLERQRT
jgi:hypothetical protein